LTRENGFKSFSKQIMFVALARRKSDEEVNEKNSWCRSSARGNQFERKKSVGNIVSKKFN
jgi:hypothetical protein